MKRRPLHGLGWILVALLGTAPVWTERLGLMGSESAGVTAGSPGSARGPRAPIARRLVGPFGTLVSGGLWVAFHRALQAEDRARAFQWAELALALESRSTSGWSFLAYTLAFDLASVTREQDPEQRVAYVRAALDVLDRGVRAVDDPAELAFFRGLILVAKTDFIDELPWPGGEIGLWREALACFELAERAGHPGGAEAATTARRRIDELSQGDSPGGR